MSTSVVFPRVKFFADNGQPLVGGRIHTYAAGSSTRARTYVDAAKAQPNANPIVLDSRGEAAIYLAEGVEYKFVIEDRKGALIMTQEPVYGAVWPNAAQWPSDATLAYQYMQEAKAAADGAALTYPPFDTYAQLAAALASLPNGVAEVSRDETRDNSRVRYRVIDGIALFLVNLDQLRVDLSSTSGAGYVMHKTSSVKDVLNAIEPFTNSASAQSSISNATESALAGDGVLHINEHLDLSGQDLPDEFAEVSLSGSGSVKGTYRKFVAPARRKSYSPVNTINPSQHLTKFSSAESPVVVIMGDSISTEGADSHTVANSMWSFIKSKIRRDNKNKNPIFHNRAIGGQTWTHALGIASTFPYWYTDASKNWLNYIEELQPDTLILAFGMNDSQAFNGFAIRYLIEQINSWEKVPDLIFVTNPVPSRTTAWPGMKDEASQEGRDLCAGWVRSYAQYYGHGIIDINRAEVAMRDGYDVCAGPLLETQPSHEVNGEKYIAPYPAVDFSVLGLVDGGAWYEGRKIIIKCGRGSVHGEDTLVIGKVAGKYVLTGNSAGLPLYTYIDSDINVVGGDFVMEVSVIDNVFRLALIAGENRSVIIESKIIRHGGIFFPEIYWEDTQNKSPFKTIEYVSSYYGCYAQTLTSEDIWGASQGNNGTKPITGGNGINHYSAFGLQLLVRPVIEVLNFSCGYKDSGIYNGWDWVKREDGSSQCTAVIPYTGGVTEPLGGLFTSGGIEITNFPAIFKEAGENNLAMSFSISLQSGFGVEAWTSSSGLSTLNNAVRFKIVSPIELFGNEFLIAITMSGFWR